jgi:hypothetical protein
MSDEVWAVLINIEDVVEASPLRCRRRGGRRRRWPSIKSETVWTVSRWAGPNLGLLLGYSGPPGKPLSLFSISVLYFLFYIYYLNSKLNLVNFVGS